MGAWEDDHTDFEIKKFGEEDLDEILSEELELLSDQEIEQELHQQTSYKLASGSIGKLGDFFSSNIPPERVNKKSSNRRKNKS